MIPVPLIDLKSLTRGCSRWRRDFKSAALVSVDGDAACLDRARPFVDLAFYERSKIFGRGTILGGDLGAEAAKALAHRRRLHRLHRGIVELPDDVGGRVLRQEDRVPGVSF